MKENHMCHLVPLPLHWWWTFLHHPSPGLHTLPVSPHALPSFQVRQLASWTKLYLMRVAYGHATYVVVVTRCSQKPQKIGCKMWVSVMLNPFVACVSQPAFEAKPTNPHLYVACRLVYLTTSDKTSGPQWGCETSGQTTYHYVSQRRGDPLSQMGKKYNADLTRALHMSP